MAYRSLLIWFTFVFSFFLVRDSFALTFSPSSCNSSDCSIVVSCDSPADFYRGYGWGRDLNDYFASLTYRCNGSDGDYLYSSDDKLRHPFNYFLEFNSNPDLMASLSSVYSVDRVYAVASGSVLYSGFFGIGNGQSSSVEQVQTNLFYGFILFFMGFVFPVWYFRLNHERHVN